MNKKKLTLLIALSIIIITTVTTFIVEAVKPETKVETIATVKDIDPLPPSSVEESIIEEEVIKEEPKDSNNVQIDNEMANYSKIEDSLSNNIPTNEPIPVERSTPLVTKKNNRRPFDSIKFNK